MIPVRAPEPAWLTEHYECQTCGGVVRFENKDRGDTSFLMRNGRPSRGRCLFCHHALAMFVLVEEDEMPMDEDARSDATYAIGQSLVMCLLCTRGYPPAEMWPRPDGYVCDECQGKRTADD